MGWEKNRGIGKIIKQVLVTEAFLSKSTTAEFPSKFYYNLA